MTELTTSCESIGDTPNGPIVAVVFGGRYPPGCVGNEFGSQMCRYLSAVVAETNAGALVLDLVALDYVWGDAIAGVAMAWLSKGGDFRPLAIVATGRTASALRPLLQQHTALGLATMGLFGNRTEAVAHLQRVIALGPVFQRWGELEQLLRRFAAVALKKNKHMNGPVPSMVDGLVSRGVLTGSFRSRIQAIAAARDRLLHGTSVPTDTQVQPIVEELDRFLGVVRNCSDHSQSDRDHQAG